jgi:hypothetical protein
VQDQVAENRPLIQNQVAGIWTYSGNPNYNAKDLTRFLIGDTMITDQLLSDQEIEWLLSQYNNTPMNAAIRACESIISRYSRLADESVGQVKIQYSQRAKGYATTLIMLRNRLAMEDAAPFAGGIYVSDVMNNLQNRNIIRPDFYKHMMENWDIAPWTTQTEHWLWLNFAD